MASYFDYCEGCEYRQEGEHEIQRYSPPSYRSSRPISIPPVSISSFSNTDIGCFSPTTVTLDSKQEILTPTSARGNKKLSFIKSHDVFSFFDKLDKVTNHFIDLFIHYDYDNTGLISMDSIEQIVESLKLKIRPLELNHIFKEFTTPEGITYMRAYRLYREYLKMSSLMKQKKVLMRLKAKHMNERHSITFPCVESPSSYRPMGFSEYTDDGESRSPLNTPMNLHLEEESRKESLTAQEDELIHLKDPDPEIETAYTTIHSIFKTTLSQLSISPKELFEQLNPQNHCISIESLYHYVNSISYIPYSLEIVIQCFQSYLNMNQTYLTLEELCSYIPISSFSSTSSTDVDDLLEAFHEDFGSNSTHISMYKSESFHVSNLSSNSNYLRHSTSVTTNLYQLPIYDYVYKENEMSTDDSDVIFF